MAEYTPIHGRILCHKDDDGLIIWAATTLGRVDSKALIHVATWDTWLGQVESYLTAAEFANWADALGTKGGPLD